ncbi:galactose oxidase-like domain-containing protein [Nonomuraea sp. NPDC050663]|uniref:galactose oxidase-like domain-containing protein n=1 Tax=Nonomuraea sp. NPDC050663 TaxID=3364370 RepID=UPI0037B95256
MCGPLTTSSAPGTSSYPTGACSSWGGNKSYPTPTSGYQGLRVSYIFNPADNTYVRTPDMLDGHWYPSATALGNGDVFSVGGLKEDSSGSVTTERWSASENRWLRLDEVTQTWRFWGLYPAMILMQDGRLFYTGSHVFGNGLPGTGASIYDLATGAVTDVPGLRRKDERDESMSVLLPPAQDQRVLTLGGGNNETNPDAHRLTDLIDLKAASPAYTPGPDLPQGHYHGGAPQTGEQGKMYVSAVLLPDGTVLETGGALHNRADPVFEASLYDPATGAFTPGLATDPVPRTYHSSAVLLPDGRVMTVGDNPGDGSFDQRVSLYSPPYLFKGPRPALSSLATDRWRYGTAQRVTVSEPVVKASLPRPAAVTHSSDPNQRYLDPPMTAGAGGAVDLHVTTNPNLAPPGWYMLTVVNAAGVPSIAKWVHLS